MSSAPKPGPQKAAPKYRPDQMEYYQHDELLRVDYDELPKKDWMEKNLV